MSTTIAIYPPFSGATMAAATCFPAPVVAGVVVDFVTLPPGVAWTVSLEGAQSATVQLLPVEYLCRECARPNAANGACYRCHPIPPSAEVQS